MNLCFTLSGGRSAPDHHLRLGVDLSRPLRGGPILDRWNEFGAKGRSLTLGLLQLWSVWWRGSIRGTGPHIPQRAPDATRLPGSPSAWFTVSAGRFAADYHLRLGVRLGKMPVIEPYLSAFGIGWEHGPLEIMCVGWRGSIRGPREHLIQAAAAALPYNTRIEVSAVAPPECRPGAQGVVISAYYPTADGVVASYVIEFEDGTDGDVPACHVNHVNPVLAQEP